MNIPYAQNMRKISGTTAPSPPELMPFDKRRTSNIHKNSAPRTLAWRPSFGPFVHEPLQDAVAVLAPHLSPPAVICASAPVN